MVNPRLAAAALALLPGALRAQDAASTLALLTERASAVVVARTDGIAHGAGALHQARFLVERLLQGQVPLQLDLQEPAGEACGRALGGLAPGRYLLFLVQAPGGLQLAVSGARAVVALDQDLEAHVQALLAAADPVARARVVIAGLGSACPRVRRDACLALPLLAGLEQCGADARAGVAAALRARLAGPTTELAPLVLAAERLRSTEAAAELAALFVAGERPECDRLLLTVLPRSAAAETARHLTVQPPADARGQHRAVQLLELLPAELARVPLLDLLRQAAPGAAARAGAALLAAGEDLATLALERSAAVAASSQRQATAARPRFRSILQPGARP